jgi:thymidylate synthase (FAD)
MNDTTQGIYKGLTFPVLDHGKVTVRNWMGDEDEIVNAAKISYGRGTKSVSDDINLLRYLLRHQHTTPFEMCEIQYEMEMPIFVARQFVRHRTANINEYSARYSEMLDVYYLPEASVLAPQSTTNKQGREAVAIQDPAVIANIIDCINDSNEDSFQRYQYLLSQNLSRELSRMVLPLNIYTKWIWKCDVSNLMKFLKLREDSHAQYEIRVYAEAMSQSLKMWMPNVHTAYIDYIRDAVTLSKQQLALVKKFVVNHGGLTPLIQKPEGMSKREFDDLLALFA